jgi:hypothetical protein
MMSSTAPSVPKQAAISGPAASGAGIHSCGKLALHDTAQVAVGSYDDARETLEWGAEIEDFVAPPPEGVPLRREWA